MGLDNGLSAHQQKESRRTPHSALRGKPTSLALSGLLGFGALQGGCSCVGIGWIKQQPVFAG